MLLSPGAAFADKGYVRGENIVSAPYDFRYSPLSNKDDYMKATMALVEDLYARSGGKKVLWISHSMGGLWSHYILSRADKSWKDKYLEAWVPIAPAYGGTVSQFRLFASGNNEGVPWVSDDTVREEQRMSESNFWLLPSLDLWDDKEVLLKTPTRSYTSHDVADFFNDIDFPVANQIHKGLIDNDIYGLQDPDIKTFVRYGVNVDTAISYEYKKEGEWDSGWKQINGDGDGTVNTRSLEAAITMGWANSDHKSFNETHTSILKNDDVIAELLDFAKA